jgi:class 3 adenylate cyclase/tetratricopeptide (TPR) repeat protein
MLFADLTASTELASRLDPEDLRSVLRPFFDAMVEEIDRYGGTVEKFIGDAIVAAFGAPVAHEDDPERAIRCALAMHRRLARLNVELAERAGGDLAMRIGINTGEVIAHSIEEGIVTGEAVNIAARFQAIAEPGRVVVGDRTYRRARHAFAFEDLGEVLVKGIDRPLHVFEVGDEIAAPRGSSGALEPPFVGRGDELSLLRLLYERTARESRPNLVTVVGPPGIGKSRLADELTQALNGRGARIVRGRCLPYGDGLTYWPLAEILRADAGILDSDAPNAVLAKARERLLPRFPGDEAIGTTEILLSSIGVEQPSDPLAGTERAAAQRLIARAWQRYLEWLASERPIVALIEDLQWADPSLLDLMEAVVSRARGPALVLCMARPDLYERRPDWGGGVSNATTLTLSPLSAADGAELIEHLLDGQAPAEVVGPILQRSEGNPFFAAELLRMMIEDGTIARRGGRWEVVRELPSVLPDTVQGVIASRIDLLTPEEKRVIQDASVIGRHFWAAGVELLGAPGAGLSIESLVGKGLVGERDESSIEGEREFVFNHVLTRDVAYASIPRARRAQAHAVVGAWIENGTSGRAEEFAEILAHHFALAGDPERTARYALLAGQRLLRVFAAEDAIGWLDRAMEAGASASPARAQVALARGGAKEQLGRFEDALADYERALSEARYADDREAEARALAAIAHVLWLADRYDEGQAFLPEALERARSAGLADVEARLLYTAGTIRFGRGEFAEALPLHEQALSVARESGDVEGEALAHHGLCESYFFNGPFEEGLAHGLQADRMLRDLGQRSMVAHNAYMVGWALTFVGRAEEAFETANASVETSREIGNRRDEAFGLYNRGEILLAGGRIQEAAADAELAVGIFRELGLPRGELIGLCLLDEVAAEHRDLESPAQRAGAALTISDALGGTFFRPMALACDGLAALATGDRVRGDRRFEEARASCSALLEVCWVARTEVLAREWANDPPGLARVGARIEELVPASSVSWRGWGPYARSLAALAGGHPEEASAAAASALEFASAAGERRLEWRAGRVAWRALQALGRTEEAEPRRAQAAVIARDFVTASSGRVREGFLARPDVAELLG